jgi:Domain of Unknown Function (DUF1259)
MTLHRIEGRSDGHCFWRKPGSVVILSIFPLLASVVLGPVIPVPAVQRRTTTSPQQAGATEWKNVEQALGKAGAVQPDGVYKVSFPRSDLKVTVDDIQIKPALALGSWLAFKQTGQMAMVMGDLVLTEDEVIPVMTKLQERGIQQTALHNHVLRESPRVMYMHIEGMGDAVGLAQAVHNALALSKTPFTTPPSSAAPSNELEIDTAQLDRILGQNGRINGGVYQFSIPRSEKIQEDKFGEIPPSMGVATAINFQPTRGGKAAVTGDFVLIADEVNPVIKTLRDNGIEVTALHSHMLAESPRLFFMHFWANDDAQKLARGLSAAFGHTNVAKRPPK